MKTRNEIDPRAAGANAGSETRANPPPKFAAGPLFQTVRAAEEGAARSRVGSEWALPVVGAALLGAALFGLLYLSVLVG